MKKQKEIKSFQKCQNKSLWYEMKLKKQEKEQRLMQQRKQPKNQSDRFQIERRSVENIRNFRLSFKFCYFNKHISD